MTIPTVTPYTGEIANPDGSQTQTEFTQNMFDQLSFEKTFVPELNNSIAEINNTASQVDTDAVNAAQSASDAQAAADSVATTQFVRSRVGNISDYVGDTLTESERFNIYQYPDDSDYWYGVKEGEALPVTIPADPTSDNKWIIINAATQEYVLYSFKTETQKYAKIDYKASGGNSAVDNMILGYPISISVGEQCSTGGTIWERIANAGQLSDFKHINPINIRDFGVKGDGSDPDSAIDTVLSRLGGGFTIMFPEGQYSGFNNFYSNSTFITSEGAVFNGVVHAAISGGPILKCENVRFIGTIVTSDRVGTYDCDNVIIDAIRQIDGNRGVHFYFNTKNLYVGSIKVEGLLNADTETSNAVFIDGVSGKEASRNISIGRIVADSSLNGAFSALKLDSSASEVSSVTVGEIISTNSDYDLFCLGDSVLENNFEVRTLRSSGGDQDIIFMQNIDGLEIGNVIASENKGGGVVRQSGSNKNVSIGDVTAKAVGQNSGLSDDRRGVINLINPLGFSLRSLLVDGVGGSNALNLTNISGDRVEIGRFEVRNPSFRAIAFGSGFTNAHIGGLIISGATSEAIKGAASSVIKNVDIDYVFIDGAGADGVYLENSQITDFTIGKLKAINCGQDGFSVVNAINDADGFKIGCLITKGNARHGTFLQDQDEGVYINNIQSSGNLQGLRAINVTDLNINGGHISSNEQGVAVAGVTTGWLVNGLRVDGNTTNGALPADVMTGNIIAP